MARIKGAMMTHKRRKKMLKLAKGFYGCKSKHFKMAKHSSSSVPGIISWSMPRHFNSSTKFIE